MNMLQIDRLTTDLLADTGMVRAVDALSLSIERGQTLALVGRIRLRKIHDGTVHLALAAAKRKG